jgi:hypothetical protein
VISKGLPLALHINHLQMCVFFPLSLSLAHSALTNDVSLSLSCYQIKLVRPARLILAGDSEIKKEESARPRSLALYEGICLLVLVALVFVESRPILLMEHKTSAR